MEIDLDKIQKRLRSSGSAGFQEKWKPSEQHSEIMERFWVRMGQLYQHKWLSSAGVHIDDDGYTETFLRWCKELSHFGGEDWKRAYNRIESDIIKAAQEGSQIWPPSSLEVVAFAKPPRGMHQPFGRPLAIEDEKAKEKRIEKGKEECSKLLALFE